MRKTASEHEAHRTALDREPADRETYDEYVRGFDEIPVLSDVVRTPPRRAQPPNFVRGERRDLRRAERPDGYSQREEGLADLERLYREYAAPASGRPKRKKARRASTGKRARPRKRASAGA
jgi:hypothetical protein